MRGQNVDPEQLFDLFFRQARAEQGSDRSLFADRAGEKLLPTKAIKQESGEQFRVVNFTRVRLRDLHRKFTAFDDNPEGARILSNG